MAKHEAMKTTREQWQEFSDAAQDDVDRQLEELAVDIEAVNLKIADLHYGDPQAAQELIISTLNYLHGK